MKLPGCSHLQHLQIRNRKERLVVMAWLGFRSAATGILTSRVYILARNRSQWRTMHGEPTITITSISSSRTSVVGQLTDSWLLHCNYLRMGNWYIVWGSIRIKWRLVKTLSRLRFPSPSRANSKARNMVLLFQVEDVIHLNATPSRLKGHFLQRRYIFFWAGSSMMPTMFNGPEE